MPPNPTPMPTLPRLMSKLGQLSPRRSGAPGEKRRAGASSEPEVPLPSAPHTPSKKRRVDGGGTPFPETSPRPFPPPPDPLAPTTPSPRPSRASIPQSHRIRYLESKVAALGAELEQERTAHHATRAQVDHAFNCVIAIHEMISTLNTRLERLERERAASSRGRRSDDRGSGEAA
ncbi:hypothetical protein Q8F55_007220 [Vanrija albida]|uniref:Uncharacterized protein n=1 Tax=Vanrija albida TaxID=181172 RepID=A0ABR3PZB6_9TREE